MIDVSIQLNPYIFLIIDHEKKWLYNIRTSPEMLTDNEKEFLNDFRYWYCDRNSGNIVTIFEWEE